MKLQGFNAKTDALLEIAAITLKMDEQGWLMPGRDAAFPCGAVTLEPTYSQALTRLTVSIPLTRYAAVSEYEALHAIFKMNKGIKDSG